MESDHVNNQLQGSSSASSSKITINESDPAEYLKMKPKKSILKSKQTSFEDLQKSVEQVISRELDDGQKEAHFDEMNILGMLVFMC
jgi:hypothetical protein